MAFYDIFVSLQEHVSQLGVCSSYSCCLAAKGPEKCDRFVNGDMTHLEGVRVGRMEAGLAAEESA